MPNSFRKKVRTRLFLQIGLLLTLFVALTLAAHVTTTETVATTRFDGALIDRIGSQRNLVERYVTHVYGALVGRSSGDPSIVDFHVQQAAQTAARFKAAHRALLDGPSHAADAKIAVRPPPIAYEAVRFLLQLAEETFGELQSVAGDLVRSGAGEIEGDDFDLRLREVKHATIDALNRAVHEMNLQNQTSLVRLLVVQTVLLASAVVFYVATVWYVHHWILVPLEEKLAEREQLQQELNQSQRLDSIGQLAAGIAHEINTPMQYVSNNVEFLRDCYARLFAVIDEFHDALMGSPREWDLRKRDLLSLLKQNRYEIIRVQTPEAVEEACEGIRRIIGIVRATKSMADPGLREKVRVDVNNLIRDAAILCRSRWRYSASMEFDLDESLPDVPGYTPGLSQVLLNLIVNAADAIVEELGDNSDTLGTITIRTYTAERHVVIEVEDTGCGMTDEVQQRLFDPFFTTKSVGKGVGHGLAVAYDMVVKHHQGTIDVVSTPGSGSVFKVMLPRGGAEVCGGQENRSIANVVDAIDMNSGQHCEI